jgi:integrase
MKPSKNLKTWEKTKVQNLVRHRSGRYYARMFGNGKQRWKSLGTAVLEVAKCRLRDVLKADTERTYVPREPNAGRMTMAGAITILEAEIAASRPMRPGKKSAIRDSSAHYRRQTITSLRSSWKEFVKEDFDPTEARKITKPKVDMWAAGYRQRMSATRFNNGLGTLRRLLEIAIDRGEIHQNAAAKIARSSRPPKVTYTPSRSEFLALVSAIRSAQSRYAEDSADFVEFLAYTGARKTEAANVLWSDVNFVGETVTFRVTKNGETRKVQMIDVAKALLQRLKVMRGEAPLNEPVLRVSEARGSLTAAARVIGIPNVTHHDMRDVFATTAIECGVDIPTVADWLGHKDGGKLLLERYSKHRDEHKRLAARRVDFSPVVPAQNVIAIKQASA